MLIKEVGIRQIKAGPEDGLNEGEFIVYPSTFTKTPDAYGDIVKKGAFLDDIAEWKSSGLSMPGLYGHRLDDPDYFVAYAIDMGEDDHGWWVKGAFDFDSPKGKQVYNLVKGRRLNQLSFAFDVLEDGQVEIEKGVTANELRKLKVYEFSFVPVGANQDTSVVAIKSIAASLLADVKAGRAISAKNESTLREAAEKISASLLDIKSVLAVLDGQNEDEAKASNGEPVKVEEPAGAKTDEPMRTTSATARLHLDLASAESDILTLERN